MATGNAVNAATAGFQSLTSGGVWNGRTLQQGTGISISNADGTGGDPTITNTSAGGTGSIVQQVRNSTTTAFSTTKTLALTGTTPTTSNTDQIITVTITPTSATNILYFTFSAPFSSGVKDNSLVLFQDGTFKFATALCVGSDSGLANWDFYLTAGTTSSTTFAINAASTSGAVMKTLQSVGGTAFYNGAGNSITFFTVTEVTP